MISLTNTLTRKKEPFEPLVPGEVRLYTCGPTVYGKVHIGNLRAYLMADTLRRILIQSGLTVRHIKNITDVGHLTEDDIAQGDTGEDKVAKKARAEGTTPEAIARHYEAYFREAERKMNILPADVFPKATEHVARMITLIEMLIARGHAYESNGNVFLSVRSFPDYGALSGNTLEKLKVGARLEEHPDKRDPWDFALWLKASEGHLMRWDSPWSVGYPGWHIECSAMSTCYLGDTFDIHTGGEDNIFPHHEAEIVQSEGATGKPFVQYWIHNRHLLADGAKMSKSKGNLFVLEDIEKRGFSPMDARLLFLGAHYRSPMNFTWESLSQARTNRLYLLKTLSRLEKEGIFQEDAIFPQSDNANSSRSRFIRAMEDDMDTPVALSVLLTFSKWINSNLDKKRAMNEKALSVLKEMLFEYFGIVPEEETSLPESILALIAARDTARASKNFSESDRIRNEIEAAGYLVEDSLDGTTVHPIR